MFRSSRARRDSQGTRASGGGIPHAQNSDLEVLKNANIVEGVKVTLPRSNNQSNIQSAQIEVKSTKAMKDQPQT